MVERYLNPRLLVLQRNNLSPSPALDDGASSIYPDPHDDPLERVNFYDTVSSERKPVPVEPAHVQRYFNSIGRQGTPWLAPLPKDSQYRIQSMYNPQKPLPTLPPLPPPKPSLWARFNFYPVWIRYTIIVSVLIILFVGIILITLTGLGHFPPNHHTSSNFQSSLGNTTNSSITGGNPSWNMSSTGQGTYYFPDAGVGSCGQTYKSTDFVAALNWVDYGAYNNPNEAPCCNRCIEVTGPKGTVQVTIVDKCPNCTHGDIDLSPVAFQDIANLNKGRVPIQWHSC